MESFCRSSRRYLLARFRWPSAFFAFEKRRRGFGAAFQHSSSCDARGWIQRVANAQPGTGDRHFFAAMNRHVEHFRIHTPRRETFFYRGPTTWHLFPPRLHDAALFSIVGQRRRSFFYHGSTMWDFFLSWPNVVALFSAKAPGYGACFHRGPTTWHLFPSRHHDARLSCVEAP